MPDLIPTEEQQAIIDASINTDDNLIIVALAGAAKTSTLVMIANALHNRRSLCLAFNRNIVNEMATRLPRNCSSMTLNSIGHRLWNRYLGNNIVKLETNKLWNILKTINNERDSHEKMYGSEAREVIEAVKFGKISGFLPYNTVMDGISPVYGDHKFFNLLEYRPSRIQEEFIIEITKESFYQACKGIIDFDDQILCPTVVDDVGFPKFQIVFTDESQDFSILNHMMLKKLVQDRRIISVGDPKQAIYGFRGADTLSMSHMAEQFNMVEYKLTTSFRCAKKIVENVHWHAPDMKATENALDGEVVYHKGWSSQDIPDNSTILCRNNAPLFEVFLNLLLDNRNPELSDKEIINKIVRIMKDLGRNNLNWEESQKRVDIWLETTLKKLNENEDIAPYNDLAACLKFIIRQHDTLGDAIDWTNAIAKQKGTIILSTIHKSKGLEYDTVFILDSHLLKNIDQDPNLRYVAETRAKLYLGYIDSSFFVNTFDIDKDSEHQLENYN